MTTNPDTPEEMDQQFPLLSADDPRGFHDIEHELDDEEYPEAMLVQCPLCGESVQVSYRSLGKKECSEHPGESHEQALIDARPLKEHEDSCEALALLRERFPDVHQPDPVLDEEKFQDGLRRLMDAIMTEPDEKEQDK